MWRKPEEGQEKPRLSWLDRLKGKDIELANQSLASPAPEPAAPAEPPAPPTEIPRDAEGEPIDSQAAISEMPVPAVNIGPIPEPMLPPETEEPPSPPPVSLEEPVAPLGPETPPPGRPEARLLVQDLGGAQYPGLYHRHGVDFQGADQDP